MFSSLLFGRLLCGRPSPMGIHDAFDPLNEVGHLENTEFEPCLPPLLHI